MRCKPRKDDDRRNTRRYFEVVGRRPATQIEDVALLTHATARIPDDALVAPLRAAGVELSLVGDCFAPRSLLIATREGHAIGNAL